MIGTLLFIGNILSIAAIIVAVFLLGFIALIVKWYKKPIHGKALVRTGQGGTKITFEKGFFVIPVLHRLEIMDITLKNMTISRLGVDGLICKDNIRADIKVAFFVRVNNTLEDAKNVAFAIGCERASAKETLEGLFESKFSEALKTVGKRFDFADLYNQRDEFKKEILTLLGRNLNGYLLDDCAIDYLEQTPLESMKERNILDAEGIKKIIELTSTQQIKANFIENEKQKTIKKQDVEAREIILTYERQLAEKEETQKREIANIKDKEKALTIKVTEEQREISEKSRISAQEAIEIAQQNKERQVIVATWNKDKTDKEELEKTEKAKMLQVTEREKVISLAQIEKDKAIEIEKAKIQEIIRDRVKVQKDVVIEEQKIKDTEEFATADREKRVAITNAEMIAEQALVKQIKNAEANRKATEIDGEASRIAAEYKAKQKIIEAEAAFSASGKEADAIKVLAEAEAAKESAQGKSEAQVIEAKAIANLKDGETNAKIIEMEAIAEAKGIEAKAIAKSKEITLVTTAEAEAHLQTGQAEAKVIETKGFAEAEALNKKGEAEANILKQRGLSEAHIINVKAEANEKQGLAEAKVIQEKLLAEAKGIDEKAVAMKKLEGMGKEHEEFKLKLQKDKDVELAQINIWKDIADAQATVISEALKSAKIDIVGGETMFFDKIIGSITRGKSLDNLVGNSEVLTSVKDRFLPNKKNENSISQNEKISTKRIETPKIEEKNNSEFLDDQDDLDEKLSKTEQKIKNIIDQYKFLIDGVTDMTIIDVLETLISKLPDVDTRNIVKGLIHKAKNAGIGDLLVKSLGIK